MENHNQQTTEQQDDLFYVFAQTTLTRLKALIETSGGIPIQKRYYVSFDEVSTSRSIIQTKNDYRTLLLYYFGQAFFEEEPRLIEQLHSQEALQQQEQGMPRVLLEFAINSFNTLRLFDVIRDAMEKYDTLDLTKEQLLESYHRYRDAWSAPIIRYETIIPLLNFSSDLQREVPLGSHFTLSPFLPEEKTQAWNSEEDHYPSTNNPIEHNAFLSSSYKLACTHLQEQIKQYSTEEINEEAMDILTALRLVKVGDVGAPSIFERSELFSLIIPNPIVTRTSDYNVRQKGSGYNIVEYSLSEAELSQVINLFTCLQRLRSLPQRGGLAVALRRFNQAYSREQSEDRIIDLTIALESCLLAGESGELSYRFALRGTALLAETRDSKEVKALLKTIYSTRSSIVHNGKTLSELKKDNKDNPPGHKAQEFLRQSEELARAILREYVT